MALIDIDVTAANTADGIGTIVSGVKTEVANILGGAHDKLASTFLGIDDFTGINENGLATLKKAINDYCATITETVNGFKEDALINDAFKGEVATAVQEFVAEVKKLLIGYVSTLKKDADEAETIFAAYKTLATEAATDIKTGGTDAIRESAANITFEDKAN